jgi:hypothetical protein
LTGLTLAETREFELLDAEPPIDEHGHLLRWETDDKSFPKASRSKMSHKVNNNDGERGGVSGRLPDFGRPMPLDGSHVASALCN